jgi:hypothetical protein
MIAKEKSLRRLFDALEYIVDERVGIIRFIVETPTRARKPRLLSFLRAGLQHA